MNPRIGLCRVLYSMHPLLSASFAPFAEKIFTRLPSDSSASAKEESICCQIDTSLITLRSFAGCDWLLHFPHFTDLIVGAWNRVRPSLALTEEFCQGTVSLPSIDSLTESQLSSLFLTLFSPFAPLLPAAGRSLWETSGGRDLILGEEMYSLSPVWCFTERARLFLERDVLDLIWIVRLIAPDLSLDESSLLGIDRLAGILRGICQLRVDFFPVPFITRSIQPAGEIKTIAITQGGS
jgi:hypothetical protein